MDLIVRSNQASLSLICWENCLNRSQFPTTHKDKYNHERCTNTTTTNYKLQKNTTTNYKLQTTELKHKLILQCKYTTTLQGYTGEYNYKLQASDYQIET